MSKIFAVIVTTSASDLVGATALAAGMRRAGAIVETPLAHSTVTRQTRRALGVDASFVLVLDGDSVEIISKSTGVRAVTPASAAAQSLASLYVRQRDADALRMARLVAPLPNAA